MLTRSHILTYALLYKTDSTNAARNICCDLDCDCIELILLLKTKCECVLNVNQVFNSSSILLKFK